MKLDILTNQWIDMVFEGRNKVYGAYELRKDSPKSSLKALGFGALFFALAMAAPAIFDKLASGSGDEADVKKIVTVKLPPKQKKEDLAVPPPPPPPPPPQQNQTKFVKPVVAKAEEVVEDPPKIEEIKDKKTGAETIKGNDEAPISIEKPGDGDVKVVEEDPNILYNSAGIEVKPDFPGGMTKFYKFIGDNFTAPEDLTGKIFVQFVVEKDGSLTDIKILRDIGSGTGAEAIRVLKKCPKWAPGEQNGKKVRCTYQLPISVVAAE